jgi:transglutaminase-like putative cysteine protease
MVHSIKFSKRWWDFPAVLLLIAALLTAATRLVTTDWTDNLARIQNLVILGALAGLALGQSRFSARLVVLFGLAYGLFAVPWQLGLTIQGDLSWMERLQILWYRADIVLMQLSNSQRVTDSILFIAAMAACFWVLSVLAGYALIRHGHPWLAILPTGAALFIIHTFDSLVARYATYLAVYIFFSLVLIARMAYLHRHEHWKESRTALPPHLGLDFMRFTLGLVVVIVFFAWTVPVLARAIPAAADAAQPIRRSWDLLKNRWENAFASLESSVGIVHDNYGDTITLGRGTKLSDDPRLLVKPPAGTPGGVRFYWRAQVYDDYLNGEWRNSLYGPYAYDPAGEPFTLPTEQGRWIGTFELIPQTTLATIYAPAQSFWVSATGQAYLVPNPDETVDLAGFQAKPSLRSQRAYQAQSSISNATVDQMRQAGADYPGWVTERYLKLPNSVTLRTRQLAQEITQGIENPYDKVVAVTEYLRQNITYQEIIPATPRNHEAIDWFLFDIKEGFCNYYATAEVVLLRALGIPARWAIGYAQGELLEGGMYLARERNAHAWPEVYFPGLGWVEFEPTTSQPNIDRLPGSTASSNNGNAALEEETMAELRREQLDALRQQRTDFLGASTSKPQQPWLVILLWLFAIVILGLMSVLMWRQLKRMNLPALPVMIERILVRAGIQPPKAIRAWARRAALAPIARAYDEINHALARVGSKPKANLTPTERAALLTNLLPASEIPALALVGEYQKATFSLASCDLDLARQAGAKVRSLSYKAFFGKLIKRFQRPHRQQKDLHLHPGN